ncbi:MAG TPA: SET domain-containing protein-lysine N-methyltransferase [Anaerolineales bacterium]|nr:SET domain-containing protein-lysine N-methyltransferase [Anaerolineales bacterium]
MAERHDGYLSPKLEGRLNPAKGGFGVYARERVCTGELLVVWGGSVVDYDTLVALPAIKQIRSVQVEEDRYLVSHSTNDPADYFNHSCNPNAGLAGQIALVAMRDIEPGDEVCFDYAMSDASPYDEFECECGVPTCRKRITGNDWMNPELQERYAGSFSPYIQRRIERPKVSMQESAM